MLSKTVKHFIYSDCNDLNMFNNPKFGLTFSNNVSVEFCLLRLLTGGVSVQNSNTNYNFSTKVSYFYNPIINISDKTLMYLWHDVFSPVGYQRSKLERCFVDNRTNTGFYINVLLEITNAVQFNSQKRYTQSFLHIYRAFEHIAYSFPLLYLKTQTSYSSTYNMLKEYFKDGGNSELAFCKQFVGKLLDSSILESTIDINFTENKVENRRTLNLLAVSNNFVTSTYDVSIKYEDVWDLIIQCRNQYFHHLSGMSNSISSQTMVDSDSFFKPINDIALQLFSTLYLSLLFNRM